MTQDKARTDALINIATRFESTFTLIEDYLSAIMLLSATADEHAAQRLSSITTISAPATREIMAGRYALADFYKLCLQARENAHERDADV